MSYQAFINFPFPPFVKLPSVSLTKCLISLSPISCCSLSSNYRLCLSPNILPAFRQFAISAFYQITGSAFYRMSHQPFTNLPFLPFIKLPPLPFTECFNSLSLNCHFCLSLFYRLCLSSTILPALHQFSISAFHQITVSAFHQMSYQSFTNLLYSVFHQITVSIFHQISYQTFIKLPSLPSCLSSMSSPESERFLLFCCAIHPQNILPAYHQTAVSHVIPVITSHQNFRFLSLPSLASIPFTKCITRLSSNAVPVFRYS